MTTVRTANSVYHLDGDKVMLESGTSSRHLPFGQWVKVVGYSTPIVGHRLLIKYTDDKARFTTPIASVEESNVGQSSS